MNSSTPLQEFTTRCIRHLTINTPKIEKCLDQLYEEEVWQKPNSSSNSVGNLIIHLCGNITQYIISSIGGEKDHRERDREFAIGGGYTKSELMDKLIATVDQAIEIIKNANEVTLMQVHSVQGESYSGMGGIIHVVEHYSYHTGQIAFWTKLLKDKDLAFYAGRDLNAKNQNEDNEL